MGLFERGKSDDSNPAIQTSGIQISEEQYRKLVRMVYQMCGINLGEGKRELLKARLVKRFRAIGCRDVREYMRRLESDTSGQELVGFMDCITTNKTDFFRESQHFEYMADHILPRLDKLCGSGNPLRIWSAACSTGEEPYTLAIVLLENHDTWRRRGTTILASDLSTKVLNQAQNGVYGLDKVAGIPRPILSRYFQRGVNRWQGHARVRPEVRKMVQFQRFNLMDPFHFDQPFHIVFCRNVMIYFDKPTRESLVNKICMNITPGGFLFVGHAESLTGIQHPLKFVRPAVYRKGT